MFQTAVRGIADFFFKQNFDSLIGYWDAGCHPTRYSLPCFSKLVLQLAQL